MKTTEQTPSPAQKPANKNRKQDAPQPRCKSCEKVVSARTLKQPQQPCPRLVASGSRFFSNSIAVKQIMFLYLYASNYK